MQRSRVNEYKRVLECLYLHCDYHHIWRASESNQISWGLSCYRSQVLKRCGDIYRRFIVDQCYCAARPEDNRRWCWPIRGQSWQTIISIHHHIEGFETRIVLLWFRWQFRSCEKEYDIKLRLEVWAVFKS